LPVSVPEKVGLSSERLQHLTATLLTEVERKRIPGAVIAVARRGQLAYFEAVGFLDPDARTPMTRDAIFSIASMTKPMVSVGVTILHGEGKLSLSDPVGKYLPALANMKVATVNTDSAGQRRLETESAERQPTILDCCATPPAFPMPAMVPRRRTRCGPSRPRFRRSLIPGRSSSPS
jgi:CubicO group peptidase (beta-lactamase class C family)